MYELSRDTVREDDPLFTNLKELARVKVDFDKKSTTVSVRFDDKTDACRYPLIGLNHSKRIFWLAAKVNVSEYKSLMYRLHYYNGPLPWCVTKMGNGDMYLYWKLSRPLIASRFRQSKPELIYKRTYRILCYNLGCTPIRHNYIVPNPTYFEFDTMLVNRKEVDIGDFIDFNRMYLKKNKTPDLDDQEFYMDANDYVFHKARAIACKIYRKMKPTASEYDTYIERITEAIGKIDLLGFDDASKVSFDDMAVYVGDYYFKQYEKFMGELSALNSIRGKKKGYATREKYLNTVLDLGRADMSRHQIARELQLPRTTVRRWLDSYLGNAIYHESLRNAW